MPKVRGDGRRAELVLFPQSEGDLGERVRREGVAGRLRRLSPTSEFFSGGCELMSVPKFSLEHGYHRV